MFRFFSRLNNLIELWANAAVLEARHIDRLFDFDAGKCTILLDKFVMAFLDGLGVNTPGVTVFRAMPPEVDSVMS